MGILIPFAKNYLRKLLMKALLKKAIRGIIGYWMEGNRYTADEALLNMYDAYTEKELDIVKHGNALIDALQADITAEIERRKKEGK